MRPLVDIIQTNVFINEDFNDMVVIAGTTRSGVDQGFIEIQHKSLFPAVVAVGVAGYGEGGRWLMVLWMIAARTTVAE